MKFSESGLPQDPLVERAFYHSQAHIMNREADAVRHFTQQIRMMHEKSLAALAAGNRPNPMSEEEYNKEVENLEKERDAHIRLGPQLIRDELRRNFVQRRLRPAQEIAGHSDAATPEAVSAALLIDCVRSPLDFRAIERDFGAKIGGIIAEIQHMQAYAGEAMPRLSRAAADIKRVHAALTIVSLDALPPGREEQVYEAVKTGWDKDRKLDRRLVDAFNRAAQAAKSPYRVEIDQNGRPDLVKGNPPPPPGKRPPVPRKPGGNNSIGGDVF